MKAKLPITLNLTSQPTRSGDLFVASSGNVGINTTSPGSTLTVAGTLNVTVPASQGNASFIVAPTGYVGIGISNPPSLFTIGQDLDNVPKAQIRIDGQHFNITRPNGASNIPEYRLNFGGDAEGGAGGKNVNAQMFIGANLDSPSRTLLKLIHSGSGGSELGNFLNLTDEDRGLTRMLITSTGDVGIGDATPDAMLEIINSTEPVTTVARDLFMLSSSENADGDRFIVKNSGNIGINATTPASKFELAGTANLTHGLTSFRVTNDKNIVIHLE